MTPATTDRRYDDRTSLVVVDVQNDFADPAGSLYVKGGEEVVEAVNAEVRAARGQGATVVYTQDWHPPDTPHFAKDGGTWPVHCVRDTWGAELHPDLVVDGPRVRKGTGGEDGYSGFTMADPRTGATSPTALKELLDGKGIERVVVVGLATDYCVKATALDAVQLGYETAVIEDAVRPVDLEPGDGERALAELAAAGVKLL
ncbi:MAG TPA: isochorismatase family protein [Acidimicrobiales bacterium]